MNLYGEVTVLVYLIEWFSFERRQNIAKLITLIPSPITTQLAKQHHEAIRTRIKHELYVSGVKRGKNSDCFVFACELLRKWHEYR